MKRFFSVFILSLSFLAFAIEPEKAGDVLKKNAGRANRKTALRCLLTATNYAAEKNYEAAIIQSHLGIEYDDSVSDLWYVAAASSAALGKTKAEILPLVERSIKIDSWMNYNRDNARLMAADIYSDTGRLGEALELLDSKPMIYSSDAEFVRCKIYYRMGDALSVSKARNKIDGARRIYPADKRFPLVFFKFENPENFDVEARRLSDFFTAEISQYQESAPSEDAELEIYAAKFASGELKERMLKSFASRGLKHPLYAEEALKANLISQQYAFEYAMSFAEDEIDFKMLKNLISLFDDEKTLEHVSASMESFGGTFTDDVDGDGIANLFVKYSRGRPQIISYDGNQDGNVDFSIDCDFGVPASGKCAERKMKFDWGKFPYLRGISFNSDDKENLAGEKFTFAEESLAWTPVVVEPENQVSEIIGKDFFYPALKEEFQEISNAKLLEAASSFEIELRSREREKISFVLLNGNVMKAMYYKDRTLYAEAQFEGNVPVLRVVDFDGDGIFETTEFYGIDENGNNVHSLDDERAIMQNLYGVPSSGAGFYLRMVQVDTDSDSVPDFTEEYVDDGGKITSWDIDSDGKWDLRHVVHAGDGKEKLEDSMFSLSKDIPFITVSSADGIPYKVTCGDEGYSVVSGKEEKFFWLSKKSMNPAERKFLLLERKILKVLNEENLQGNVHIIEENEKKAFCIKVAENIYALPVDEIEWNENEKN